MEFELTEDVIDKIENPKQLLRLSHAMMEMIGEFCHTIVNDEHMSAIMPMTQKMQLAFIHGLFTSTYYVLASAKKTEEQTFCTCKEIMRQAQKLLTEMRDSYDGTEAGEASQTIH